MTLESKFIRRDENVITRQCGPAMPPHNGRFVIANFVITGFLEAPGFMPGDGRVHSNLAAFYRF